MPAKTASLRPPSKPDAKAQADVGTPEKPDDESLTKKPGHIVVMPMDDGPVPEISLAPGRFAAKILLSLAVFVAVLSVFAHGVTIQKNVSDPFGSAKEADRLMWWYQPINGVATSIIGNVFEGYVTVFIVVATTFMRNQSWHLGDDPTKRVGRIKRLVLWLFCPAVMYNVNVAVTSMFVSYKTTGFDRMFVAEDLTAAKGVLETTVLNATTAVNMTSMGNGVSILDTILRGAVLQKVTPFDLDPNSQCMLVNVTATEPGTELPTVKEARSTAVVYGFPTRPWNVDALPFGLVPNHSYSFNVNNASVSVEDTAQLRAFMDRSNISWPAIYEKFLQGKLLFERSVSDTEASAAYPCVWVDNKVELDLRANDPAIATYVEHDIFREGENKGKRRCFGAKSTLGAMPNITDPANHHVESFLSTFIHAFMITSPEIESESAKLTLEVYNINPQLKLTSMTLDMAYYTDRQYRNTSDSCDKDSKLRPGILASYRKRGITVDDETLRKRLCDKDQYAYVNPRAACGHSNCIFLDQSGTMPFKKQLQLVPYMTNCSTEDLTYDTDFHNFLPTTGCVPVKNAAFLYGLGSYMAGDVFDRGSETGFPYISNPRRHIVVTFAKLEWQFTDVSAKFGAKCGVNATRQPSQCSGLIYNLENVTVPAVKVNTSMDTYRRVLVVGERQLPVKLFDLNETNFRTPVQLLSLNSRRFFYPKSNTYYEWEYLDMKRFKSNDWAATTSRGGLDGKLCSPLVDAYISTLETNNYYMDDPRQPLYTAALLYLFQDAAVKTVKVEKNNRSAEWVKAEKIDPTTGKITAYQESMFEGTTTLKGDRVEHKIMFKITWLSMAMTFVGLMLLRVLAVVAMATPIQRMRKTEEVDESVAHQYARLRQEDEYPKQAFDRGLKLRAGRLAMDDFVVKSLTLHHKDNISKKIHL